MLEIVHDLAPGAQLYFSSGGGGALAMIDSINWLVAQGCDVIVDDLGFYQEHFFSDTAIAQTVTTAIAGGVTYVTAAGNDAELHYQRIWNPSNGFHDFDPTATVRNTFTVGIVPVGGIIDVYLQWSDAPTHSANNYDLRLLNRQTGALILDSTNPQSGSQSHRPLEFIQWTNNTGVPVEVSLAIPGVNNPLARELEFFVLPRNFDLSIGVNGGVQDQNSDPYNSIFGHPAVEAAITVGAINADEPGTDMVASYSSLGESTIVTDFST